MLNEESDITYQGYCFFWYLLRQVVYFIDMCHVICMNILERPTGLISFLFFPQYSWKSVILLFLFFISQYVYSAFIGVYTIHCTLLVIYITFRYK